MRWIQLLILLLGIFFLPKFCRNQTDGFQVANIHSTLPYNENWDVDCGPLPDIFDQKFSYLASGGQAYAFVSADGKYVIKFFKHHLRRLPFWLKILPLPENLAVRRDGTKAKRLRKFLRDFTSYKLSYEQLPKETGVLYVHLNKTDTLKTKVQIIDKLKIEHTIDLDGIEFVVQKRADLVFPYLAKLIENGEIERSKRCIRSILDLVENRCAKGIYDEDPRLHRNFGFVDDQAIVIDVGRLRRDPTRKDSRVVSQDLCKITASLQTYLDVASPELATFLKKELYDY